MSQAAPLAGAKDSEHRRRHACHHSPNLNSQTCVDIVLLCREGRPLRGGSAGYEQVEGRAPSRPGSRAWRRMPLQALPYV